MSDDSMNHCNMCGESFTENDSEWFCDICANSEITTWKCMRCGNEWSPDYSDERMYSDCCHPMMESDIDIDEILYCEDTWKTVWPGEKNCSDCDNDSGCTDNCKRIRAYTNDSCKLKEF